MPQESATVKPEAQAATSNDEGKNSTATATGEATQAAKTEEQPSEATFTQADLNRIVKKELDSERSRAKKAAEAAAQQEKGEFEKLATTYKADLDALQAEHEEMRTTMEALTLKVGELVKQEMKALPETVRELAPTKDAIALLDWLPKAKKAAETMQQSDTPAAAGNARGPKPVVQGTGVDAVKAAKEMLKSRGRYTGF